MDLNGTNVLTRLVERCVRDARQVKLTLSPEIWRILDSAVAGQPSAKVTLNDLCSDLVALALENLERPKRGSSRKRSAGQ